MSPFWSWFVVILTVANVLACWWLIWWTSKRKPDEVAEGETIEHRWDGDLQERNNPLPRWWLMLFHITIVFGLGYLVVYPALGSFKGTFGWSQTAQYQAEMNDAEARFGPIFAGFVGQDIETLANNPDALKLGHSLFANNCTTCHGSDARGAVSFPNLADNDWLWGGEPEEIKQSILGGRQGVMPPFGTILGEAGVEEVLAYVQSLSGREVPATLAQAGQTRFAVCAACHGADATGNQLLGAPNLTDDIWLHSNSEDSLRAIIVNGLNNEMPAHEELLGKDKAHLLAAYVYSLSRPQ